jgi:hypothetical protein
VLITSLLKANQEDAELRVFDKEKALTHGLAFLKKFIQRVEQQNGTFQELDSFREEAGVSFSFGRLSDIHIQV